MAERTLSVKVDGKLGIGQNQSPKTYLVGTYANGYWKYRSQEMARLSYWVHSGEPVGSFANGYARSQR
jgi:hypothetical protein